MGTIQGTTTIRRKAKRNTRSAGDKKEQNKKCSVGTIANGFLRHQFLPLCEPERHPSNRKAVEKGFFDSVALLSTRLGLEVLDVCEKPYPCNVLLAHWDICRQLIQVQKPGQLFELSIQMEDAQTFLSLSSTLETNRTLYYIPVIPLYHLLQQRSTRPAGRLLLMVCAYLYQVADIPYYREGFTALNYHYDMIEEWTFEEMEQYEPLEGNQMVSELYAAAHYGDIMLRRIRSPYHLVNSEELIHKFKSRNELDKSCKRLAEQAFELYRQYPKRRIHDNIPAFDVDEQVDGIIHIDQYVSFVADTSGWLSGQVEQMVNAEMQEMAYIEEPVMRQDFKPDAPVDIDTLEFEAKVFDLLHELCYLLNHLP